MFNNTVTTTALSATLETSTELHALLRKIDPASFHESIEADARAQLQRIIQRLQWLREASQDDLGKPGHDALPDKLGQLVEALERAQRIETATARAYWAAFQREVHPAYESLAAWLRTAHVAPPSLRPTNYSRNLFHIGSALTALVVILLAPSQGYLIAASAALCLTAWSLEIARRFRPDLNDRLMGFFGKVAHVHERYRVNSSTWYVTALLILAVATPKAVAALAVVVLGIGDPIAALVGRRFGKTRLRAGRSLEGSLGFVLSASLGSLVVAAMMMPGGIGRWALIAMGAGFAGAVAEVFSTKLDDNLTIPLAVAAAVTALIATGV